MNKLVLSAALTLTSLVTASAQTPTAVSNCNQIGGIPSVGVTRDNGLSWATSNRPMPLGQGTFGMAVARGRNEIISSYRNKIYVSHNGGCAWRPVGPIQASHVRLVGSSHGGYAWNFFSAQNVWRIDLRKTGANKIVPVKALAQDVVAIGVDPADDMHVRGVGEGGGFYDSFNGGDFWVPLGPGAPVTPLVYFAAFDPNNLDHAIVGMAQGGVVTTLDGGATWTSATGLTQTGGSRNSFYGVISESDPSIVWVESIDLDESGGGAPSNGKHIYRSTDGGLSFTPVVDAGGGVTLVNGAFMMTDPSDADVVYFPFGASTFGNILELYRYDHGTGQVTWTTTTTTPQAKIRSMVFSPLHSSRIVVGFEGS